MRCSAVLLLVGALALAGFAGFVYSGRYPVGADVPHFPLTTWILQTVRDRSVARAARGIEVPRLDRPELLLAGGPDYREMCSECHLAPGQLNSDMRMGLYPVPPNLARRGDTRTADRQQQEAVARRWFWIIKHGIKASAMPAWGLTHDDARIWAMVAFLLRLPDLTPDQYQVLTTRTGGAPEQPAHGHGP